MSDERARVGIIGAGVVGLSTAYALLERGVSVHVHEVGTAGGGQSGGDSRIFRHAHDDPRLVRGAIESRAVYDDWSRQLGQELVSFDGAVAIGPAVERQLPLLEDAGVPARRIDSDELATRVPILAGFDGPAMVDERGGSIRTVAMLRALVAALGERLLRDEVLTVEPREGGVEVRCGGSIHHYERVVVCAGRQTGRFARSVGLSLPVRHGAHVRLTYALRSPAVRMLATLQDSSGTFGQTGVYAAAPPGNSTYAVGLSDWTPVRADGSPFDGRALDDLADRASTYVRRALPGLDPEPIEIRHCWVTELPWSSDGLAVWESAGMLFPVGHNLFKQAPALGRKLAAAVDGEALAEELRPDARLGAPPS